MPIWEETRGNAMAIGQNAQSGARKFLALLRQSELFARVRVHLIAHSAGAIAQTYLASAMIADGWKVNSLIFMAPAARASDFDDRVREQLERGTVERYLQFHLTDEQENADRECQPFYDRSLLFLVSEAFEGGAQRPMLGMERYFSAYGAKAPLRNVTAYAAPGVQSRTVSHSGFARDPATLNTVLDYIKAA
jgi:pimeloyl-ACP methyl ester carboxylesterase